MQFVVLLMYTHLPQVREGYLETIDNLVQADATEIAMSQINTQSSTRYITPPPSPQVSSHEQHVSNRAFNDINSTLTLF